MIDDHYETVQSKLCPPGDHYSKYLLVVQLVALPLRAKQCQPYNGPGPTCQGACNHMSLAYDFTGWLGTAVDVPKQGERH
jgi:hypothetical protein